MIEIDKFKELVNKVINEISDDHVPKYESDAVSERILKQEGLLLTDLVIPWEVIDDSYVWAAQDLEGWVYAFKSEPTVASSRAEWIGASTKLMRLDGRIKGVIKSNKPWKETLIRRPEVNPHALVIDWSLVPKKFVWAAMDKDGAIFAYTNKPNADKEGAYSCCLWNKDGGEQWDMENILPDDSVEYWRETLTKRPEGV